MDHRHEVNSYFSGTREANCRANASIFEELSRLWWAAAAAPPEIALPVWNSAGISSSAFSTDFADGSTDSSWLHPKDPPLAISRLGRLTCATLVLLIAVYAFKLFTFVADWDPRVVVLTGLPCSAVLAFIARKLRGTVHPHDGALATMCQCRSLTPVELTWLRRWWVGLRTIAVAQWLLGWVFAGLSLTYRAEAGVKVSAPVLSSNPAAWGGHAGSPLALGFRAAEQLALHQTFALTLWPWLYSLIAATVLCDGAADVVRADIAATKEITADSEEGAGQAVLALAKVGRGVHTLQEEMLVHFSEGWGGPVGLLVTASMSIVLTSWPQMSRGFIPAIFMGACAGLLAALLVLPLAIVTSRCNTILNALNGLRTYKQGNGTGMVLPEINMRLNTITEFIRNLNRGRGMGIVVLNEVISVSVLVMYVSKVCALASLVLPILINLQGKQEAIDNGSTAG